MADHSMPFFAHTARAKPGLAEHGLDLGAFPRGFRGRILGLREHCSGGLPAEELERRLLELGFVEGAQVEILHQGLFGGDPIAVRVQAATIALRRREASAILVEPLD